MYLSLIIIPLMFGFASDTGDSWQVALCNIGLFGSSEIIHCDKLQDTFILKEGTNITIDLDNATKTATFSSSGGSGPNELYCTVGKWFNAFNGTTNNFNCETVPTGAVYENNTASNLGSGTGLFTIKTGVNLPFKSLVNGSGITLSNNATTVTITASGGAGDNLGNHTATQTLNMKNNILDNFNYLEQNGASPATIGAVRLLNNQPLAWRNNANTDNNYFYFSTVDALTVTINGAGEYQLTSTGINFAGNNATSISGIDQSGDNAESGFIQLINSAQTCFEASPTGTDQCVGNNTTEDWVWDSAWNVINFGLNPFNNAIFDVVGTGNNLTSTGIARGDILRSDTNNFVRLARGSDGQVLTSNSTDIYWATPSSSGGSGIPLPPKKWGELIPRSGSIDTIGLVAGCSILATASYVYDTTDNSNAILSTTAVTDGINGGIHCSGTNYNSFRGDQNAYMYSKVEWNKITTNRIFVGFQSGATHLPNNADTILDNLSGYGLCIRTSDTLIQECRNDGDATTDYASTGITETADTVYAIEVYAKSGGTSWCYKINGSAESCQTTEIPATTTRLYPNSTGETDGGATAILWTQYLWYLQSDK